MNLPKFHGIKRWFTVLEFIQEAKEDFSRSWWKPMICAQILFILFEFYHNHWNTLITSILDSRQSDLNKDPATHNPPKCTHLLWASARFYNLPFNSGNFFIIKLSPTHSLHKVLRQLLHSNEMFSQWSGARNAHKDTDNFRHGSWT
jgi:hypothetical protein